MDEVENVMRPRYSLEYQVRAGIATLPRRNENYTYEPYGMDALGRHETANCLSRLAKQVFAAWSNVALKYTEWNLEIGLREWGY
jgi:hypothetical protein